MITKHSSPVVVPTSRNMRDLHPGYHRSVWADYGDLLLMAGGCFAAYLFVMYYCIPTVSSHQYARTTAELSYYWQNTWEMTQHQLRIEYYPYIKSVLPYLEFFL